MKQFESVNDALDYAIGEEEAAAAFYQDLAEKVKQPGMNALLLQFANEEKGHKMKLLDVKSGNLMMKAQQKVTDLKIGDYMVDVEPGPELTYQDALIVAMKKEKAAYRMYVDLSASTENADIKNIFLGLAAEEANHKLRFELEYDNEVMTEN